MNDHDSKAHQLWFLRHRGKVTGPYPLGLIKRYIILNRISDDDELSFDQENWRPFKQFPELAVETLNINPDDSFARQRLLAARRWADERVGNDNGLAKTGDIDRRSPDLAKEVTIHNKRRAYFKLLKDRKRRLRSIQWLVSVFILVMVIAASYYVLTRSKPPADDRELSECHSSPHSAIKWNNCQLEGLVFPHAELAKAEMKNMNLSGAVLNHSRLSGADLSYSIMSFIDLSSSDLTGAILIGANLRGADLTRAKLVNADLSYADLMGADLTEADLSGAKLDHVKWLNGYICKPGSNGECR